MALRYQAQKQGAEEFGIRSQLMQEQNDLSRRGQDITREQNIAQYGSLIPGGTGKGTVTRGLDIADTQAQTAAAKVPANQQQFSVADSTFIRVGLKQQGLDKPLGRFLDSIEGMAKDSQYTKGKTYLYLKKNWPSYQQMIVEDIGKELEKTTDPMQIEKLTGLMKEIGEDSKGDVLDAAMPETARAIQMENAEKAGQSKIVGKALLSPDGKIIYKDTGDQFEEPYTDKATGSLLQKNITTGEVKKISSPEDVNKETKPEKKLSDIKKDYFAQTTQYYNAQRGVGQFIEDPNKQKIADEAAAKAAILSDEYIKLGGNPEDLGITTNVAPPEPKMPDPVANKGKVIRDTETGQRYKSDGTNWIEIE